MKLEQLIVQHLYHSKQVTLQGIGTFRLDPSVALPVVTDKDFVMPADAIRFEYDPRASEDEALIDFIVQHTRKMKALATSDLESYIALSTQFLNIGKPLVIEGIGTIQKTQSGEFGFIPGNLIAAKTEDTPKPLKEKKEEAISFQSEKETKRSKNTLIATVLLLLVIVGFAAYYFLSKKTTEVVVTTIPVEDTVAVDTAKKDTTASAMTIDSSALQSTAPKDSFNFKVIIKEYHDTASANTAFRRLTRYGHKLIMEQDDSTYKLAMPFYTPLSDTTRARDSMSIFFKAKTRVEL